MSNSIRLNIKNYVNDKMQSFDLPIYFAYDIAEKVGIDIKDRSILNLTMQERKLFIKYIHELTEQYLFCDDKETFGFIVKEDFNKNYKHFIISLIYNDLRNYHYERGKNGARL